MHTHVAFLSPRTPELVSFAKTSHSTQHARGGESSSHVDGQLFAFNVGDLVPVRIERAGHSSPS